MGRTDIYQQLLNSKHNSQKKLAVLIDPDKVAPNHLQKLLIQAQIAKVDYIFVGGSLVMQAKFNELILNIKAYCNIPVIIFPGSLFQLSEAADAIFLLSLISGRNPELLIGQHVLAAPILHQMELEIMSTGYLLVDGGAPTTVSYISNSTPIPHDKPQIAVCTALAGAMLGMKIIYLDAGSGAKRPVSPKMIQAVNQHIDLPLIIGGGINTPELAVQSCQAGADVIVVGTAFEHNPDLIVDMANAIHSVQTNSIK